VHQVNNSDLHCQRTITRVEIMQKQITAAQQRKEQKLEHQLKKAEEHFEKKNSNSSSFYNHNEKSKDGSRSFSKSLNISLNNPFSSKSPIHTLDDSEILTALELSVEEMKSIQGSISQTCNQ
jgi:translation initiation factor 2B subunit (eIF-2B alpha/beta/delta family)